MPENLQRPKIFDLLFGVRRSVRYHVRRRRFFGRARKLITFLTAMAGVATLALVLAKVDPRWVLGAAVLVSLTGVIDLILDTAGGARLHGELARRFIELEMDMVEAGENIADQQLREFAKRRLRIELDEPPTMRVLDCVCHNELVQAMGQGREYEVNLTRMQRFFANFLDICPGQIRALSVAPAER